MHPARARGRSLDSLQKFKSVLACKGIRIGYLFTDEEYVYTLNNQDGHRSLIHAMAYVIATI